MIFEEKHSRQNYSTALQYQNMRTLLHCQTSMEILFVSGGIVSAVRQQQHFRLSAGQCIWIQPYEVHAYDTVEPNSASVFIFSPDWMPDFAHHMEHSLLNNPVVSFSDADLHILADPQADRFRKKSVLYALASSLLAGGVVSRDEVRDQDQMVRMMLFIQNHYLEPITMDDLAKDLGYSYHYTSHLFRSCFSRGFREIITEHRLSAAAALLREKKLSITQIASECGFSTIRNFNLAFREHYRMSPGEYQHRLSHSEENPVPDKIDIADKV